MTTALLDELGEHFPMGRPGGVIVPTMEPIADTDSTPLGLTLRVAPITAGEWGPKPTTTPTTQRTDGAEGEGTDESSDSYSDQTW